MRTDSTRISPDAVQEIRDYIAKDIGAKYLPATENVYKSKKAVEAQDAHEAIRPTNVKFVPDQIRRYLSDEQYRLYKLIWERAVTSQMTPAVFDQTTVDIEAKADTSYDFRTTGSVLKFDGFLRLEEESKRAKANRDAAAVAAAALIEKRLADASDSDDDSAKDATSEESSAERRLPELNDGQALVEKRLDPQEKVTEAPPP